MNIKVAVCVPSNGQWRSMTSLCIANMVQSFMGSKYEGGTKDIQVMSLTGSILPEVRTFLVSAAWSWDATHILWVDSDMAFPSDTIQQLLNRNEPIVAANYVHRQLPTKPTAFVEGENYIGKLFTKEDSTGLVEVKQVGMGLMLVDMRVFDALELPFFMFEPVPPYFNDFIGEDYFFCRKAREAGFKIYVDQDLSKKVEHIGEMHFTHLMADVSKQTHLEYIRGLRSQGLAEEAEKRRLAQEEIDKRPIDPEAAE